MHRSFNLLILGLCYFVIAALSAGLARFGAGVAFIWLANAVLLAELHCHDRRAWLAPMAACAVASFAATALFGMGLAAALPLAIINVAEAAAGAAALAALTRGRINFSVLTDIAWLALVAVAVPAASGVFGASVAHLIKHVTFWPNWIAWVTGHALGILTVTPVMMMLLGGDAAAWVKVSSRARKWELFGSLSILSLICVAVFWQDRFPLLFLPFLPLMMCVFRFGRLGAAASLFLLTLISAYCTMRGAGPIGFVRGGVGLQAQFLEFYLAVATVLVLPVAAELKRRNTLFSQLQRNAAIHRVIVDRTGDVLMTTNLAGIVEYASPSIRSMAGFTVEEVIGRRASELLLEEDREAAVAAHRRALADPQRTVMVEHRARDAAGEVGWFESHIRAIISEQGEVTGAVSIVREISSRKAREDHLAVAASTDPLTGLANRRALEAAFGRLVADPRREWQACIAVFDLDHFKGVNDTFGHAAGDEVLKAFARILEKAIRTGDLAVRLGGEEFAAILVGADWRQAEAICERVRRVLSAARIAAVGGEAIRVTVSVGLTDLTRAMSLEEALKTADGALYEAKQGGRDRLAIAE